MRRRKFITLVGGAAAAWPLGARTQQPERMRLIGVLMGTSESDPEERARLAAFLDRLQQLGWTNGRNVRIDTRWPAGDADRNRTYAAELVGLAPGRHSGLCQRERGGAAAGKPLMAKLMARA